MILGAIQEHKEYMKQRQKFLIEVPKNLYNKADEILEFLKNVTKKNEGKKKIETSHMYPIRHGNCLHKKQKRDGLETGQKKKG